MILSMAGLSFSLHGANTREIERLPHGNATGPVGRVPQGVILEMSLRQAPGEVLRVLLMPGGLEPCHG